MATDSDLIHFLHSAEVWRSSQPGSILEVEIQWVGPWINIRWVDQDGAEHRARVAASATAPAAAPKSRKTPAPSRGRSLRAAAFILRQLEAKVRWLTAEELAALAEPEDDPLSLTTIKHEAAALVKEERLKNKGKGYGLPSWPDP
jgi:hypothetical protein